MTDLTEKIKAQNAKVGEHIRARDYDGLVKNLYAKDCKVFCRGLPVVEFDGVAKLFRDDGEKGVVDVELNTHEVIDCGQIAVERGYFNAFKADRSVASAGHYNITWKQEDGVWKVLWDIFT